MTATDWSTLYRTEQLIAELERKAGHHALEPAEVEQLDALRRQRLRLVKLPAPVEHWTFPAHINRDGSGVWLDDPGKV